MYDHRYRRPSGETVPVSSMTTEEIEGCLADGIKTRDGESIHWVLERLRLELFIRQNNLRTA